MLDKLRKIPGALMLVPLLLGALLNTVDQMHLAPVEAVLRAMGTAPVPDASGEEHYELLRIGGFLSALTKAGALSLIGFFLVCVASQMDFAVGRRALKKGAVITLTKLGVGIAMARLLCHGDPFDGFLGLSVVAVVAAMTNGNGGLYVALTGEYGNKSDVGAVSVISTNDGPFFTLLALGMLGEHLPIAAFLAVLVPMVVGFLLGRWDPRVRAFLAPGERLSIPFFAFALGTTMNFAAFLQPQSLLGGLFLGAATVLLTGAAGVIVLRLVGERSQIAAVAEGSTAGNAVQTPLAVAAAAAAAAATGAMDPERAAAYEALVPIATAQVSISTLTTALLCPAAVVLWDRRQRARGIDGRAPG